jgi:hypothetical protein
VTGTKCQAIATNSVFYITLLPMPATTRVGDIGPFTVSSTSPGPFTLNAHGTCTTEVRAGSDGRLVQRKSGTSYSMSMPAYGFWISNAPGCSVSVT